ncbi:MAG: hypothetical protein A2078_04600 [Nitrospirae bacterium GWC2_57_9]|nr:MAG: hypothetical protein A2078_04600 [Nitrospirae bacterium GWC2_57_9]
MFLRPLTPGLLAHLGRINADKTGTVFLSIHPKRDSVSIIHCDDPGFLQGRGGSAENSGGTKDEGGKDDGDNSSPFAHVIIPSSKSSLAGQGYRY